MDVRIIAFVAYTTAMQRILTRIDVSAVRGKDHYNLKRSHQGYRLKGRTPAQALRESLGRKSLPPIVPKEDTDVLTEAA